MSGERHNRFARRAANQRNAEILDSSLACFNERGCFRTKVDHVVAEVGIGKGTLYRHYPSQEELFKATLQAGIEALRVRCQAVWETHGDDPDTGLRAVIGELISLNHRGEAVSPATLARLACYCQWMSKSGPDNGHLEAILLPFVRSCQTVRLLDQAADPSLIAAVTAALVNSPTVINYSSGEPVEESGPGRSPRSSGQTPDAADRLVELIQRAFPSVRGSVSSPAEP